MDDGLQDLQTESLKKEIEKLRQTVGSSAVDDSDATSEDEGALRVDYDDFGGDLSEHDDVHSERGKTGVEFYIWAIV